MIRVAAYVEDQLFVYAFRNRPYADKFVELLKPAGYPAEVFENSLDGDAELKEMLTEMLGPDGAEAQLELLSLQNTHGEIFARKRALERKIELIGSPLEGVLG